MFMSDTIRYTESEGFYFLSFEGDIRVTLCASFDDFIETIFAHEGMQGVVLDLSKAKNIDSTALGMIAKLSAKSLQALGHPPTALSTNPDIDRILECMGLDQVLTMVSSFDDSLDTSQLVSNLENMPLSDHSTDELCEKVIEAHRVLMNLNASNQLEFRELVSSLENERSQNQAETKKH